MSSEAPPEVPALLMSISEDGYSIAMTRSNIADDQWAQISVLVAGSLPRYGRPVLISPDQLVSRAGTLRAHLRRLGARLQPDQDVIQLLGRLREDQQGAAALLRGSGPGRPVPRLDGQCRLHGGLRPFQERDLERLWNMHHGANFSVPGAGKTRVTYALHLRERAVGRVNRLLVVAPLSAFEAWEEEATNVVDPALSINRWKGQIEPDVDVLVINYQRLRGAIPDLADWMHRNRVHLVVDEAHRAKRGSLGEWGRGLLSLAPLAQRRDVLTGTPAPNHPRDLVAILDIIWPGGMASKAVPPAALIAEPTTQAVADLSNLVRPLYVRTTKVNLALPPMTFVSVPVRMGPLQKDIYDAMLRRYSGLIDLGRGDADMFGRMGEITMYLIQAAVSPQLLASDVDPARAYRYPPLAIPPGSQLGRMIETYADHEVPVKIAEACKIVFKNSQDDRKTLVWSNFPGNLLALEQQLIALQPAIVYGGIPSGDDAGPGVRTRERELRRFREDQNCRVLLANPAAMAEGVSLHHICHDAIYIDRTFNAGQYLQSLDRIHRLGLSRDTETRISLLTSEGTIDDRVNSRVRTKMTRLGQMLADPGLVPLALPDDDDFGPALVDDLDLQEVLDHLAGACQ